MRLRRRALLAAMLGAVGLAACDSGTLWRHGDYVVYWIDVREPMLGRELWNGATIRRVGPSVSAVGANEHYIVAEQFADGASEPRYYYIAIADDRAVFNEDEITQGPFASAEFLALSKRLGLPSFSKRF